MDILPFIQFTLNSRFILRWIVGGIVLYIPVLNLFSIGFLCRTSRLSIIGGMGLPTWQGKYDIFIEGIKLLFVFILYNAIPFFLFSSGFFLTTLTTFTAIFGHVVIWLSFVALVICSFLVPFAFATFAEQMDFRGALEFERIFRGIREVFFQYLLGYAIALCGLYVCTWIMRIPWVGFIVSSVFSYYIFLLSTYYFTGLYMKTSLPIVQMGDVVKSDAG